MTYRAILAALAGVSALALATGALAAPAAKAEAPGAVELAYDFPIYDSVIDPLTAAIRAALADAGKEGSFLDKRDAAAVAEYYAEQGYAPSWTADGKLTDRAKAIIARIKQAEIDGLDPARYTTPVVQLGQSQPATLAAVAEADVLLSHAIVTYARHAHSGQLDPAEVSQNFEYKPHLLDPLAVLATLATSDDPAAVFASYSPKQPEFIALHDKLAEVRNTPVETPILVPEGQTLKIGVTDPRVVILRRRLTIADPTENLQLYDEAVAEAVKAFQGAKGLKADGILGKGTLAILNALPENKTDTLLVNMERWRWMPEQLGDFYVRVNIPNFNLDVYRNGVVDFTTRIVVGETDKQTPVFSDEIETAVVNPTWNVPASIAVKEMLPKLQSGQSALNGYQVFANFDGRFRPVDPMMVDWSTVDMKRIQIKQPPGERNALGSIKFLFPNPYAVYLHDTPSKSFFERDYRALSHGCMRVMNPWDFAAALLQDDPNVSVDRLRKLVGGREAAVALTNHIPVHITYFTAWIDGGGALVTRNDVYGHDKHMKQLLGLGLNS
jgi:murein L,D-transpeptidase YcbB/YkuD